MSGQIPYPADVDREAEIADARYARALSQVTVYDVLSLFNDLLSEAEPTQHPCYHLARHVLKYGAGHRSGRHYYAPDHLTAELEKWLDQAVERCVVDILNTDQAADMALDLE